MRVQLRIYTMSNIGKFSQYCTSLTLAFMLTGDNVVKITFKVTIDQVSSLCRHGIRKNNFIMIKLNFVLRLTSVVNFFLPICFKWKVDTFRKSISRAFTEYCSDKSPCSLRNRYIVTIPTTLLVVKLDLGIFFLFLRLF